MKVSMRDFIFWTVLGALAFAYGDINGRKESLSRHLVIDMAMHCSSIAWLEKIPSDLLEGSDFNRMLQIEVLRDTIKQINATGFQKILKQGKINDDADLLFLWNIYCNSVLCLRKEKQREKDKQREGLETKN